MLGKSSFSLFFNDSIILLGRVKLASLVGLLISWDDDDEMDDGTDGQRTDKDDGADGRARDDDGDGTNITGRTICNYIYIYIYSYMPCPKPSRFVEDDNKFVGINICTGRIDETDRRNAEPS